jgi:hypothetical protein
MMKYLKAARDKKKISLRLSTRLQEKKVNEAQRIALENKLRKATGLKPITNLDQLNEDKDEPQRTKPAKDDAELVESGNILVDYLAIKNKSNTSQQAQTGVQ